MLTIGEDGWMHVLSVETGNLLFRTNCAPPLKPGLLLDTNIGKIFDVFFDDFLSIYEPALLTP